MMKKPDLIKVMGIIAAAYPNMKDITEVQINVWFHSLKDLDIKAVQLAVQQYILEGTFPPSVAEIRKRAMAVLTPELPEKTEAWEQVMGAIKKFGYARETEALKSMEPVVARAAKSMGWREICHSQKPDVVRGQFLRMYESISERQNRDNLIPLEMKEETKQLREMTNQLTSKMAIE